MGKWIVRAVALVIALILLAGLIVPAFAAEQTAAEETSYDTSGYTPIRTVEELQAIAQNPTGSYVLADDLNLEGVEWKPIDFEGVFDGAGHAILNLTLTQLGDTTAEAYDGNRKVYEVNFAGLFNSLKHAEVRNLKLVNVRSVLETDVPCFVGGLTGYSYESRIENCTVTGVLELRAFNQIFGLGGVVGYGSGAVDQCDVNVILICVDTDRETKDEQFLGGVYSTGFMDVTNTNVRIHGYVSEHGYAHNGGITGMYMQHPLGTGKMGNMTYNRVEGKIKFFENNRDRRAYCAPFAGEMLMSSYVMHHNLQSFKREEIRTYDQEIRPCMCETPDIREYQVYSNCATQSYGNTSWECWNCGHWESDHYLMLSHSVSNWELVEAPTLEKEGLSVGICDDCGSERTRVEPVLVPETEPPTIPAELVEQAQQLKQAQKGASAMSEEEASALRGKIGILLWVLGIAVVALLAIVVYLVFYLLKGSKKK